MDTQRPLSITIAVILLVLALLLSLTPFASGQGMPARGQGAPPGGMTGQPPPQGARPSGLGFALPLVIEAVSVLTNLAAVIGLWRLKKWGMALALAASALILLFTVPAIFMGSSTAFMPLLKIALAILIIVLVLLPISRQAFS